MAMKKVYSSVHSMLLPWRPLGVRSLPFLKQNSLHGVIKPTSMYGSVIWDYCSVESLARVLKLQKRAARIILDTEKTTSIFLFNILNWLPFTKESDQKNYFGF